MTALWRACFWQLAAVLALSAAIPCARAQAPMPAAAKAQPLIPAENHPWARFPVGSWTRTRATKESYDARGVATTSVEEVRTVLKAATASSYTVSTEGFLEIGGRRFAIQASDVTAGLSGETPSETVQSADKVGESELVINGRKVLCEVRQAVLIDQDRKRKTVKVFYSPEVRPHALRREWVIAQQPDAAGSSMVEEVVSAGLPYEVLGELRSAAFLHTVHKQAAQTKESVEVICYDVPGGVVAQWSKDLDAEGKLIHRTTKELIDFQVQQPPTRPATGRTRIIDRKRARREQ